MERSKKMQEITDDLALASFGVSNTEATVLGICVRCKKVVEPFTEFKNEVSAREFEITRLCQGCQDVLFAEPPDDEFVDEEEN